MSQFGTGEDADEYTKYTMSSPTKGNFSTISREVDYFVVGNRYLVFVWEDSWEGAMIGDFYSTRINDDGTIAGDSVFAEFKGHTVEQMMELAERAREWHESE